MVVRWRRRCVRLVFLGLALAGAACSRVDLTAIRRGVSDGGGTSDSGSGDSARSDSGSNDNARNDTDSGSDGGSDSGRDRGSDSGSGDDGRSDSGGSSVVCPTPVLSKGDTTRTVTVGSMSRSYQLHVPQAYDGSKPVPLILDFHAMPGSASSELSASAYPGVVDKEGVVMAFPEGLPSPPGPLAGNSWNVGSCCVASFPDDVAFAKNVVEQIKTLACIDSTRVFAVGPVMGGGMAYKLACDAADVFAGVASSGWDLLQEDVGSCKPSRAITVVAFRSQNDVPIPYGGGPSTTVQGMPITFLGAQKTFQTWASLDHCTGSPSPDSNGCSAYNNCDGDVQVVLCSNTAANASLAWPLLKQHPKPP
jgi:polyhydroxybutyrate depolymerase